MRRSIIGMFVFILAFSLSASPKTKGYEVSYSEPKSGEIQLNFTMSDYKLTTVEKDGIKYSRIANVSSVYTDEKGYAEIPKIHASIQLENQYDVTVSVSNGDYTELKLDHPLLPSRGTIYRNQDPSTIPFVIDPASITDSWYPENITETSDPYVFRDVRGVNIYAYPIRYNAADQTVRIYKSLTVSVIEDITKSTNPLTIKPNYVAPSMNDAYRSMFLNYSEPKFTNQIGQFGEMLVVYTSRDATVIQPYIDWKRQKGFKVQTSLVAVGTNVKTTVKNAYTANTNILYVQLVGDWADIKCDLGGGDSSPMDPILGCVVGTDLYPELIVGRFSAESTADVTVQVNKTINYEKNPDMAGTWYSKGLGIASAEGSGIGDDGEIDYDHMDVIKENKLLPYNYDTVYEAYSTPTAADIAGYVNAGLGIINYCGHGANTYWVTSGYSNTNVNSSTNGSKLPFIISVACVNGEFDVTTSFAEAWLRKSAGGAVATLMATINLPWVEPMIAQDYMNDIIIGGYNYSSLPGNASYTPVASDKRTSFGSIVMNGNVLMLAELNNTNSQNTISTWMVFGDASLQVRTATPTAINNSGSTILLGSYDATITKTTGGAAVQGALVSLYKDGVTYSAFTNASGAVSIAHGFSVGDQVTLTVSGYNLETEQSTIMVSGDVGGTFAMNQTSLSYGNIDAGATSVKTFTVTNSHATQTLTGTITTPAGYSVAVASKEVTKDIKNSMNYAVAPGSSKTFNVTFEPTAGQTYSGNVVVTSTDTGHATQNIAVTGTGIVPEIDLSVASLSASAAPNTTALKNFNINNTGLGTLNYSISTNYTSGKDAKGSGGPDSYGYKWKDSDETGGPVYSWVDISTVGTAIALSDDAESAAIAMGMTFNLYGVDYTSVVIAANGAITFNGSDISYTNAAIPATATPQAIVAPFWDDLNPGSANNIFYYYDSANSRFIVSYVGVVTYGTTNANTFQIILNASGKILFQYGAMNGALTSCTIGIENGDGTIGTSVVYNAGYLKSNHAILFSATPEWLSLNSTSGTVAGGKGSVIINATCDATDLELGTYTADLTVVSNDTSEPSLVIPVTFVVSNVVTPGTPSNVITTVSGTDLIISWTASANATSYDVYFSTEPYGTYTLETNVTTNSYTTPYTAARKFWYIVGKN